LRSQHLLALFFTPVFQLSIGAKLKIPPSPAHSAGLCTILRAKRTIPRLQRLRRIR
jgi:hypothetical protein